MCYMDNLIMIGKLKFVIDVLRIGLRKRFKLKALERRRWLLCIKLTWRAYGPLPMKKAHLLEMIFRTTCID